jgi:hypothetical protein
MRIFLDQTNKNHLLTADDFIGQLKQYGMSTERKTFYENINRLIGFEVNMVKKRIEIVEYLCKQQYDGLTHYR